MLGFRVGRQPVYMPYAIHRGHAKARVSGGDLYVGELDIDKAFDNTALDFDETAAQYFTDDVIAKALLAEHRDLASAWQHDSSGRREAVRRVHRVDKQAIATGGRGKRTMGRQSTCFASRCEKTTILFSQRASTICKDVDRKRSSQLTRKRRDEVHDLAFGWPEMDERRAHGLGQDQGFGRRPPPAESERWNNVLKQHGAAFGRSSSWRTEQSAAPRTPADIACGRPGRPHVGDGGATSDAAHSTRAPLCVPRIQAEKWEDYLKRQAEYFQTKRTGGIS